MSRRLAVGDHVRLAHWGWSKEVYTVVGIEDGGFYRIARADGTVAAPSYTRSDLAKIPGPLSVECLSCDAAPGKPCQWADPDSRYAKDCEHIHMARRTLAATI